MTNLVASNGVNGVGSVLVTGKMRDSTIVNCRIKQSVLEWKARKIRNVQLYEKRENLGT